MWVPLIHYGSDEVAEAVGQQTSAWYFESEEGVTQWEEPVDGEIDYAHTSDHLDEEQAQSLEQAWMEVIDEGQEEVLLQHTVE